MRMMKKALTTAELMIALTIIGVIATLVLPILIHDYNNKLYVEKLKNTYNILTNAIEQACIDNEVSYFGMTMYARAKQEENFIEKYFPVSGRGEFGDLYQRNKLSSYNANSYKRPQNTTYRPFSLRGGQVVYMLCNPNTVGTSGRYCYFIVDVNGPDDPNIAGRDIFTMQINQSTNAVTDFVNTLTACTNNTSTATVLGETLNLNGAGCFYQIITNGWKMTSY